MKLFLRSACTHLANRAGFLIENLKKYKLTAI